MGTFAHFGLGRGVLPTTGSKMNRAQHTSHTPLMITRRQISGPGCQPSVALKADPFEKTKLLGP